MMGTPSGRPADISRAGHARQGRRNPAVAPPRPGGPGARRSNRRISATLPRVARPTNVRRTAAGRSHHDVSRSAQPWFRGRHAHESEEPMRARGWFVLFALAAPFLAQTVWAAKTGFEDRRFQLTPFGGWVLYSQKLHY